MPPARNACEYAHRVAHIMGRCTHRAHGTMEGVLWGGRGENTASRYYTCNTALPPFAQESDTAVQFHVKI